MTQPTDRELLKEIHRAWVTDEMVEDAARILYTAMRFERMESTPPWVERGNSNAQVVAREVSRAVLTRWGRPTIEPVPVAERLPEVGDWVWHCYAGVRLWEHGIYNGRQFFIGDGPESQPATHWLPHHALPLPTTH
jgi:hypothetical protein